MHMKKTMLLVSCSPSTNVGLRSYLTQIFGRYIQLEARLADDVTSEIMEQFDLVIVCVQGGSEKSRVKADPEDSFPDLYQNLQFYVFA